QRGRITEIPNSTKRYERIAADYFEAHKAGQRTLGVPPANKKGRARNEKIRNVLIDHSHVEAHGREHSILIQRDLTAAQRSYVRNYEPGDMLMFRRGAKASASIRAHTPESKALITRPTSSPLSPRMAGTSI